MSDLNEMVLYCKKKGYEIKGKEIRKDNLVFEERVKMNRFYCGKYNLSWRCPPKIPEINVPKLIAEFEHIAFIYLKRKIDPKNFDLMREESSLELHKALLECEKYQWDHNNSTSLSFIGGSCKLCKNGCSPNHCVNPYLSRSPVEALGINVVKSAANEGISIDFPPEKYLYRIGLFLW